MSLALGVLLSTGPGGAVWRGRGVVLFVSRDAGLQWRGGRPKLVSGQRQRRPRRRSARSTKLSELSAGMTRASPTLLSGPSSSSSLIPCRPTRAVHRRPTLSVAIRRCPSPSIVNHPHPSCAPLLLLPSQVLCCPTPSDESAPAIRRRQALRGRTSRTSRNPWPLFDCAIGLYVNGKHASQAMAPNFYPSTASHRRV